MGIVVKVLSVRGKKTEEYIDSFGPNLLYPCGTERTVLELTWRGFKKVEQVCSIVVNDDDDLESTMCYNKWVDKE